MVRVPDVKAIATMRHINQVLNREVGGSTGTNLYAAFQIIADMRTRGETGSVVSMICDSGSRYKNTYYNDSWLSDNGLLDHQGMVKQQLVHFQQTGEWSAINEEPSLITMKEQ
jgi:cysteine synthase A